MKKEWVKIMIRLEPHDAKLLSDASHSARLPVAAFARELLLNRMPAVAVPAISDLCLSAQSLLNCSYANSSNLSQLQEHCARIGPPFTQLLESIEKLIKATRKMGLDVKAGSFTDARATELFALVSGPSESLNNLARALNSGMQATRQEWFQVLTSLQTVLLPDSGAQMDAHS